ncbi:glycosyl transferase family 1 [Burkholderia ubonensis]|uniref:glycosyltransferase family 4 protein n=1 Tax=Burkholderia ubonensis TaxID=101571 RepID=UPI0007579E14|nr:glycosyltransferase family 4 protein [Burkholderia ubonensis]KVD39643.1 glycosyl transferase family 1 [Burkholderia ubonensis]
MARLKLLLTTYSTAFITSGGGESDMVQIAELLDASGVHCDMYGIGSRPLSFYDGVMHFSVHAHGYAILKEAADRGKSISLWPNVWWNEPPSDAEIERITEMARLSQRVLFKSEAELANFTRHIRVEANKCSIVPIGVSEKFLAPPDRELLLTFSNVSNFCLCLGLIEPVKNQLELIRALNEIGMNGLFVGGPRDDAYYRQCVSEAHHGIEFLPFVQPCSALLRSIVANCEIMVEPSSDPPGRSSLEGAMMRKPLVTVDGAWQREHFGDEGAWYAASGSSSDLANAIRTALNDPERQRRIDAIHNSVMARHRSSKVAPKLVELLAKDSR